MIQKTKIEWCDYTANPIRYRRADDPTGQRGSVWACVKASEGCQHCYAETLAKRFQGREFTASAMRGVVPYVDEGELRSMLSPRRLPAGSRCFVGDMTDVFGPWVPFQLLDRVFAVMALRPDVVFQVLTKRPERMREYLIGNSGHSEARLQEVINVQGKGEVSLQLNRAVQQRARRQSPGEAERSDRRPERFRGGQGVLEVHPFGNSGNDDRQPSGIGDVRDREDVLPRLHGGREVVDRVEERMEHICGERGWCAPSPLLTWPLPNVWLGTSVEDQRWADVRIPELLATPAAVRFVSCEPLLGPLDLEWCAGINAIARDWAGGPGGGTGAPHPLLNWVIVGGESGPGAGPCDVAWVRSVVSQCRAAGVAVFVKQLGAKPRNWCVAAGLDLGYDFLPDFCDRWDSGEGAHCGDRCSLLKSRKGGDMTEWPEDLKVREFPAPVSRTEG